MKEPQMPLVPLTDEIERLRKKAVERTRADIAKLEKKQAQGFNLEQQREQEYLDRVDPKSGEEFFDEKEC